LKSRCINGHFATVSSTSSKCISTEQAQDEERVELSVLLIKPKSCGKSKRTILLVCVIAGTFGVCLLVAVTLYILYVTGKARYLFRDIRHET
jgi:hypothetical protein